MLPSPTRAVPPQGGPRRGKGGQGRPAIGKAVLRKPAAEVAETDEPIAQIDEEEAKSYDNELVMRCLEDKVLTESKLKLSIYDFGGQSVFNVSVSTAFAE